jgi:pyruvate/2-oxoglutarate/acetoin dehydrogenase E1 component
MTIKKIDFCSALQESIFQIMKRYPEAIVYGIGVPDHTEIFGSIKGIYKEFGEKRCFDTPLSEDALAGFGLGASLGGMKPIFINIRVDFLVLAMNQIINMISSYQYLLEGKTPLPFVVRAVIGRGWGQGCQHSKSLHSVFAHIPGLKVVMPTTPSDAKGLFIASVEDNNPVIFIEHRWLYWQEDWVSDSYYKTNLGEARVLREGEDITIVGTSWMNVEALQAADILKRVHGISVEIVDPRTIYPLDRKTICESVKKTSRCLVADNDWVFCGFSAEVAAMVSSVCFRHLKQPVRRLGFAPTPCPTARHLENKFYPNAKSIVRQIEQMFDLQPTNLEEEEFYSHENRFKGPF